MIDGGMTVFAVGGREFSLKEMMREVAKEYAEGRCTLGEFCCRRSCGGGEREAAAVPQHTHNQKVFHDTTVASRARLARGEREK